MRPEIITVHDIHKSIEDVGIQAYANTLVQEMGGGYFYVEADLLDENPNSSPEGEGPVFCPGATYVIGGGYTIEEVEHIGVFGGEMRWWKYRVWPIPIRLAWFIIDALRVKSSAMHMGTNSYPEEKQAVYLVPGTEIFEKEIEVLTEIPASLRPVVVDKL